MAMSGGSSGVAAVLPTSFPSQTVLQPLLNIRGAADAVTVNVRGPSSTYQQVYKCDNVNDNGFLIQNMVPNSTRTCLEPVLNFTYEVQIGYTAVGCAQDFAALPFLDGTPMQEFRRLTPFFGAQNFPASGAAAGAAPLVAVPMDGTFQALPPGFLGIGGTSTTGALRAWDAAYRSWDLNQAPGVQVFSTGGLKFRSQPLNSVIQNLDLKLNGQATSIASSELCDIAPHLREPYTNGLYSSTYPFYQDVGVAPFPQGMMMPSGLGLQFDPVTDYRGSFAPTYTPEIEIIGFGGNVQNEPYGGTALASGYAYSKTQCRVFNIIYKVRITEALQIAPFRHGDVFDQNGITRLMTMSLQASLGNLQRMLVVDPMLKVNAGPVPSCTSYAEYLQIAGQLYNFQISLTRPITLPAVSIVSNVTPLNVATVAVTFSTPAINSASQTQITPFLSFLQASLDAATAEGEPATVVYEADLPQVFTNPIPGSNPTSVYAKDPYFTGSNTWQVVSPALRLPSMPMLIYLYVKPDVSFRNTPYAGWNVCDHYLNITKISVNFMDRTGLLSTFDEVGLYRMSVKNGYRGSFKRWKFYSGSVLILDVAEDLCINPTEAPGQNIYSTFQATITGSYAPFAQQMGMSAQSAATGFDITGITYTTPQPFKALTFTKAPEWVPNTDYQLYVTTVIPGKCAIGGGQAVFLTDGPSPSQLFEHTVQRISTDTHAAGVMRGGGFSFGSLFSHAKRMISHGARWALGRLRDNPEMIQKAANHVLNAVQSRLTPAAEPAAAAPAEAAQGSGFISDIAHGIGDVAGMFGGSVVGGSAVGGHGRKRGRYTGGY